MITLEQEIAGNTAVIKVVEDADDMESFAAWLDSKPVNHPIALDTETTGLDIFSEGFRVRAVQFGIGLEAWVLLDEHGFLSHDNLEFFLQDRKIYLQNAAYDVLVIKQYYGLQLDWDLITDTKILAHLANPVPKREGGVGHSLQELTAHYLDAKVAEEVKGSMALMSKETGLKKAELFAQIPWDNETYLRYAGMDVVLTYGLHTVLQDRLQEIKRRVPGFNLGLIRYEHEVARVCAEMESTGFLVDEAYAQNLSDELEADQDYWEAVALVEYGTESVNANAQVAADLQESGVRLTELTDSGAYKLDKSIIEPLAEEGHRLAIAVTEAKKAKKWRTSWVQKFLDTKDGDNRCHASINPLAARTARMSITGIPAQTLPASDWTIRRCFVPDPGETLVSCDYQAQELRVLAALSGDQNMQRAFREDDDLHQITADASGVDRSVGKTVNFAYVYGSGAGNIAATTGVSVSKAREVIKGFESSFPGVKKLSTRLQNEAKTKGYILTATGRVLPVDQERPYAALNYLIQSTSRDITAAALLRLDEAGFGPYLRLPIHDEILACVPSEHAEWGAKKIAEIMQVEFKGVTIAADADVLGESWGGGYVNEEEKAAYEATF